MRFVIENLGFDATATGDAHLVAGTDEFRDGIGGQHAAHVGHLLVLTEWQSLSRDMAIRIRLIHANIIRICLIAHRVIAQTSQQCVEVFLLDGSGAAKRREGESEALRVAL